MNREQFLEYIDHHNNKRYDAVTSNFALHYGEYDLTSNQIFPDKIFPTQLNGLVNSTGLEKS